MKALILAAGLGSRLAPLTDNCPKCLVSVNGKPIIFKQIDNLYDNNVTDITVISGYKAEVLKHALREHYPNVNIIHSEKYASTNNMYSAYLGKKAVGGHDFIMMNADVFFDSSVINSLLACKYPNAVVTDIGRYIEESMKVVDENNYLSSISKQITPDAALGTSIDVYKFSKMAGEVFFDVCKDYIEEKKEVNLWSEVALNQVFSIVKFRACPLVGRWVEIDNHEDLFLAEQMFNEE